MKLHRNRVITCFSLLLIVIFVTAACTLQAPRVNSGGQPQREYSYQIPEKVNDGLEVSSLKEEGIAREFINRIQNLRKDSGFEVTDKIILEIQKHDEINSAIKNNEKYISSQTLSEKIELIGNELNNDKEAKFVEIDENIKTYIKIRKA